MQYDDTPPGPPPDWPVPGADSWRAWHQPPGWLLLLALGAGIALGVWAGMTWPGLGTGPGDGTVAPPPPTTIATTVPGSEDEVTSTPAQPPTTTAAPTTTQPPTTTAAPTTTQPPTTTAAPTTTAPTTTGPPDSSDAEVAPEAEPATTTGGDQAVAAGGGN